jgi:endonuclease/exonuclease/phosphatase family metal-dependent hydrolase
VRTPSRMTGLVIVAVAASALVLAGVVLRLQSQPGTSAVTEGGASPSTPPPVRESRPPSPAETGTGAKPFSFGVATFNVLGHSHTKPGGNKCCRWAQYDDRTRGFVEYLDRHRPDVVGLQEYQAPHAELFDEITGDAWGTHRIRDNAVIWRRSDFSVTKTEAVTVPYFYGKPRRMPVVHLRHRVTGRDLTVINVHHPASVRGPAAPWRREAEARMRALVETLRASGRPVLLVGDFNDRKLSFCTMTADGLMVAANGGSNDNGRCRPPPEIRIDWIFGAGMTFSDYSVDFSTRRAVSDHPMVLAQAHVSEEQ